MGRRKRKWKWMSAEVKAELWCRWKQGEPVSEICKGLEMLAGKVWHVLKSNGGYVPRARKRSERTLTLKEREEISRGLALRLSMRQIAAGIGRAPSTVSREIGRCGGNQRYRAERADRQAWKRARRPKRCKLLQHRTLRNQVAEKLADNWSPEQISGWLKAEFPHNAEMQISHETIYKTLFIQARGALKKELIGHLRSQRPMRKTAKKATGSPVTSTNPISIRQRPAEVEDRAVPGHWEGDLLAGGRTTAIATLVERQSRFVMLVKIDSKQTASVVSALIGQVSQLPVQLRRSLTWDRGSELTHHQQFTMATDVQVYFCDPHSPWQRGSNENTNGLLRQYFPKGTDLSKYSQAQLNKVALQLNQRPRKTLGFRTPAAKLQEALR
jgi:IS30 family transposase